MGARRIRKAGARRRLPRWLRGRTRLALDLRDDALYWARFDGGSAPLGWGRVEREPGEELAALLARAGSAGLPGGAVELALRSPDLEHRRLSLEGVSFGEAASVGARRAEELGRERPGEAICSFVRGRAPGAVPLWLCAAPSAEASQLQEAWEARGFEVARIASHHLALGNLGLVLEPPDDGGLLAILDFESEYGTCVIADAAGWLFSRQIPLKFAGEKRLQGAERMLDAEAAEEAFGRAERITTEVERTLRYVQSVLALGSVGRIVLSGSEADGLELGALASVLSANLQVEVRVLDAALSEGPVAGAHPGAAVALGIGLSHDPRGGDLLPETARRELLRRRVQRRLTRSLIAAAAVAACFVGAYRWSARDLAERVQALDLEWRASRSERLAARDGSSARERAGSLAAAMAELERAEPSWTAALDALGRLAPDHTLVERLAVTRRDGVWQAALLVEARAETVSAAAVDVSTLARALDESPLFALDRVERQASAPGGVDAAEASGGGTRG